MTRYEPWSLLHQIQRELERSADSKVTQTESAVTAEWTPAVDIREEADRYVLWADVPGVQPDSIDITMDQGILTLKGERETFERTREHGFKRVERVSGSFYRRFSLPDSADADGITARSQNGVLEIAIPKKVHQLPKKIQVLSEAA